MPQVRGKRRTSDRFSQRASLLEVDIYRSRIIRDDSIKAVFECPPIGGSGAACTRYGPSLDRLEEALRGPEVVATGARAVLGWMEAVYKVAVNCLNIKNKQWVVDCGDLGSLTPADKKRASCMLAMVWTSLRMKLHVHTELVGLTRRLVSALGWCSLAWFWCRSIEAEVLVVIERLYRCF